MPQDTNTPSQVLLVEDDAPQAMLIARTLQEVAPFCQVRHVGDGEQALDYLFRRGDFSNLTETPRPHFILLDLRVPKIDGLELLQNIKHSEQLASIPTIVLTSSESPTDLTAAYKAHANSYLIKPTAFPELKRLMQDVATYWFNWNRLCQMT